MQNYLMLFCFYFNKHVQKVAHVAAVSKCSQLQVAQFWGFIRYSANKTSAKALDTTFENAIRTIGGPFKLCAR